MNKSRLEIEAWLYDRVLIKEHCYGKSMQKTSTKG